MRNNQSESLPPMAASQDTGLGPQGNTVKKDRRLRKVLIFLGVLILAYIYSDSLFAQQSSAQRVSIGQAADFPNDI